MLKTLVLLLATGCFAMAQERPEPKSLDETKPQPKAVAAPGLPAGVVLGTNMAGVACYRIADVNGIGTYTVPVAEPDALATVALLVKHVAVKDRAQPVIFDAAPTCVGGTCSQPIQGSYVATPPGFLVPSRTTTTTCPNGRCPNR